VVSVNSGSVTHNVGGKTANALVFMICREMCMNGVGLDWSYPSATSDYRGSASVSAGWYGAVVFFGVAGDLQVAPQL